MSRLAAIGLMSGTSYDGVDVALITTDGEDIGRLGPTEFAALAPGTDALGAQRLAARLAASLEGGTPRPVAVRCGYEAVANAGDAPLDPLDLLVRASGALRTGKAEAGWSLRRFENETGIDAASA